MFFEASSTYTAPVILAALLAQAWHVAAEEVHAYNIRSETYLLASGCSGGAHTGDARLLEIGSGPLGIEYADSARTMLIVRPATLCRLTAAQRLVEVLRGDGGMAAAPAARAAGHDDSIDLLQTHLRLLLLQLLAVQADRCLNQPSLLAELGRRDHPISMEALQGHIRFMVESGLVVVRHRHGDVVLLTTRGEDVARSRTLVAGVA